jgi:hypothetical protein
LNFQRNIRLGYIREFLIRIGLIIVAQASLQRQRDNTIQTLASSLVNRKTLDALSTVKLKGSKLWLWGAGGFTVLLLLNPAIVLSLLAGGGMMGLVYVGQRRRWRLESPALQNWWSKIDRKLITTLASGVLATLGTYMAIAIWSESDSPWLATGILLQGAATLGILLFLIWRGLSQSSDRHETSFETILTQLTDVDPLKRLIAIRQATRWVTTTAAHPTSSPAHRTTEKALLLDCFHLMLNRETDPILRNALMDGLQTLSHSKQLPQGAQSFSMPTSNRRTPAKIRRQPNSDS